MKKNKTMAYALAASLLVGGTFVGTKAWFTDTVSDAGELVISTGNVDITTNTNDVSWTLTRKGGAEYTDGTTVGVTNPDIDKNLPEASGGNDTIEGFGLAEIANNLKPGDLLEKTITVTNEGTLVANLSLSKDNNTDFQGLKDLFTLEETFVNIENIDKDDIQLEPGDTAEVKLTLKVNERTTNQYNSKETENKVINLKNAWVITAQQKK